MAWQRLKQQEQKTPPPPAPITRHRQQPPPPTAPTSSARQPAAPLAVSPASAKPSARQSLLPLPVQAVFIKDLRYFWRDPQLKASMLSSLFILIVIFVGPLINTRSGYTSANPW